jgi:hypothetical protein
MSEVLHEKHKEKMSQDNPFAKLGAIDQKLYQETIPKPAEATSIPDRHRRLPLVL